jgi:hypothetical protein
MSDNTFFVSETLVSRLSANDLENQSKDLVKIDHTVSEHSLIESTVYFKDSHLICTVSHCEIFETLHSITFLTGLSVSSIMQKFSNKSIIKKITLNDSIGEDLAIFDVSKKKYNVVLTKCKDDVNYKLQLIFI